MKFSPEFKITVYVIFAAAMFLTKDVTIFLTASLAALCFFLLYSDRSIRSGIVPISIFLIITFLSGLFFTGGRVVVSILGLDITEEGLRDAIVKTARVFLMIAGAKLLMLGTTAVDMIKGLGRLLPHSSKSPVGDFVEITGMALKAFPAITMRLRNDFREKATPGNPVGLMDKARLCASLIIPLLGEIINSPERLFADLTQQSDNKINPEHKKNHPEPVEGGPC
ncbi:MAG: hypothetical protein HQL01_09715 [Nitrospirae bacterium]|nr:hypothetical protein [Nitrospirota bacterium]